MVRGRYAQSLAPIHTPSLPLSFLTLNSRIEHLFYDRVAVRLRENDLLLYGQCRFILLECHINKTQHIILMNFIGRRLCQKQFKDLNTQ